MKHLLLASLITLLAFSTACGQASEPEPVASNGIQVHGHWTVTVTNPDGTLDAVHEFDNKLDNMAENFLALLLAGRLMVDANKTSSWGMQTSGWLIQPYGITGGTSSFGCKEPHAKKGISSTYLVAQIVKDGGLEDTKGIVLTTVCTVEGTPTGGHSITNVDTQLYFKSTGDLIGGVEKVPWNGEWAV